MGSRTCPRVRRTHQQISYAAHTGRLPDTGEITWLPVDFLLKC
jgi:hypothetical protein